MKHYSFENPEGSDLKNITVPGGTAFPSGTENAGELFFRTDLAKLFFYDGTSWVDVNFADSTGNLDYGSIV